MSMISQMAGTHETPAPQAESPVVIIPYNANFDDRASLFLPWFWQRLKEDGLLELYYPGQADLSFAAFVQLLSGAGRVVLATTKDDGRVIGFASLTKMELGASATGVVGFIFLKEFWDRQTSDEAGRLIVRHWFDNEELDVVIGVIAKPNHLAQRYAARLGFTHTGDLPLLGLWKGATCSVALWVKTRQEAM